MNKINHLNVTCLLKCDICTVPFYLHFLQAYIYIQFMNKINIKTVKYEQNRYEKTYHIRAQSK